MQIANYAGYFHDGTLYNFEQTGDHLKLTLESGSTDPGDIEGSFISIVGTFRGILHLEGLTSIREYHNEIPAFSMKGYEIGRIYDMEIKDNSASLVITWDSYDPDIPPTDMFEYNFVANKIYWENTPLATAPFDDNPIEENTQYFLGGNIYQIRWDDHSFLTVSMKTPTNAQKPFDGWLSVRTTRVLVNGLPMSDEKFDMDCDGTIVDLKINTHNMVLEVDWKKGPPGHSATREVFEIESWATDWNNKPTPR